jgi:DNA adenine methylase
MKSCLKWVGSKAQILDEVLALFPRVIQNYYEPFLGSGTVLLGLLSNENIRVTGTVYASDLNKNIVDLFVAIQSDPEGFIRSTQALIADFKGAPVTAEAPNRSPQTRAEALASQESYYYWVRSQFNTSPSPEKFLFLNKTCFRGLYRENRSGHMNVPYGNNVNPSILDPDHIRGMSRLIQGVIFTHEPYESALARARARPPGDWVYVDPPYCVETATSFTAYTSTPFDPETLFGTLKALPCRFLMSNADVPAVRDAFPVAEYTVDTISCRRAINSKAPASRTNEVLVRK